MAAALSASGPLEARSRALSNVAMLAVLERVLDLLDSVGIEACVLKGAALLDWLYRIDERRMGDLDILVHPKDFRRLKHVLLSEGFALPYRPRWGSHEHLYVHTASETRLDVHKYLDLPSRWRVSTAALMSRASSFTLGRRSAKRLSDEDLVLHMAINCAKDRYLNHKSLEDMRRLVGAVQLDWQQVLRRANEMRCRMALWACLKALAEGVVDGRAAEIPEWVVHELEPPAWRRRLVRRVWSTSQASASAGFRAWVGDGVVLRWAQYDGFWRPVLECARTTLFAGMEMRAFCSRLLRGER